MAGHDTHTLNIAGYEVRMNLEPGERPHVERAAKIATDKIKELQQACGGTVTPAKISAMAAFQIAFDLSLAESELAETDNLRRDLEREKEAVHRLEGLLSRVDEALAY